MGSKMNLELSKSVISDANAKIRGGAGVEGKSSDVVIRYWERVRPSELEEAVKYLRLYTSEKNGATSSRSVENLPIEKTILEGFWRCGEVTRKREEDGTYTIFQELKKGFVQTVKTETGEFDFSEFLTEDGNLWHSGASNPVLKLPNVDPAMVEAIRAELQSVDTFSNPATKYETLTGTYYYINTRPKAEDDGSSSILLFLSKHNNSDLYFQYQADPYTINGFFFKWEATETTLATLESGTYFKADGTIDTQEDPASADPRISWNLQEVVAGRKVEKRTTNRDPEDRLFDVEFEITWRTDTQFSGATAITISNGAVSSVFEQGFRATEAQVNARRTTYANLTAGQTGKFDVKEIGAGLWEYSGVIVTKSARSDYVELADQTAYYGSNVNPESGSTCNYNGTMQTWTEFKASIGSAIGNARIDFNEDGTLNYIVTTSGTLTDSDWTYYKGDTLTERVIVLRSKTDAEIDTALGTTYAAALAAAAGKRVELERIKDDAQKITLTIHIFTSAAKVLATTTVSGARNSAVTEQGWSVSQATAEALDAGYASLPVGTQGKIEIKRNEDGTYDYMGVKVSLSSTSDYIALADQTAYYGANINPASGATCKHTSGTLTWAAFQTALGSAMGSARIDFNEDGTLNYVVVAQTSTERFYKDSDTAVAVPNALLIAKGTSGTLVDVCRFGHYTKEIWVQHGIKTDSLPTFTPYSYSADGLSSITTKLAGPGGTGEVQIHEDGKYSWTLTTHKTIVNDVDWHIFGIEHDTVRLPVRQTTNFQQIRRRVAGEIAFRRDPSTNAYTGVRWNNLFDADRDYAGTNMPAAWVTAGYYTKYGAWNPNWEKSFLQNYLTRSQAYLDANPTAAGTRDPLWGSNHASTGEPLYIGTLGHVFIAVVPTAATTVSWAKVNDVWFAEDTQKFYYCDTAFTTPAVALTHANFTSVTTANVDTTLSGMPGLIGQKGVGAYPCEQPDYYIPILQELEREVDWDNDWDLNYASTANASEIPLYLGQIYLKSGVYYICVQTHASAQTLADNAYWDIVATPSNGGRVYGGTAAPTAWAGDGYDGSYGAWIEGWEKSFTQNYLTRNLAYYAGNPTNVNVRNPLSGSNLANITNGPTAVGRAGHVFISTVALAASTVSYAAVRDVWYAQDTGNFYVCNTAITTTATALTDAKFTVVTKATVHFLCPGMPGSIGIRGVGSYPIEDIAKVCVLGGDGSFVYDTNARVSFYTSPIENPRMVEIYECLKQQVQALTLYTYFAVNPHWLTPANRRIPTAWADLAAIKAGAYALTNGVLPLGYNAEMSNFGIKHKMISLSDDIYVFEKIIELRGEFEADADALAAIIARSPASSGILGTKAIVYTDLTAVANPSWTGTFKDAG